MIESTRLSNGFIKLTATAGLIHNLRTDEYSPSFVMLPTDTLDMYEEVAEKPAYTEAEYKAKVSELIRERYTEDDEFALINNVLETPTEKRRTEYAEYQAYRAECKERARAELSNP